MTRFYTFLHALAATRSDEHDGVLAVVIVGALGLLAGGINGALGNVASTL